MTTDAIDTAGSEAALRRAVAEAVEAAEPDHRSLLQSIVTTARAMFGAAATSICLVDDTVDEPELVFEAVCGEGEDEIVGNRFPADEGIAGWVVQAQEPVLVSDVSTSTVFSRRVALRTGYLPTSVLAAPLVYRDEALGVLEVLDHRSALPGNLQAIDLLMLFAEQASVALGVVRRSRRLQACLEPVDVTAAIERVTAALSTGDPTDRRRAAGHDLLRALDAVLSAR